MSDRETRRAGWTRWLPLLAWIGCIFAANWAFTTFGFVPVGFGLLAPAGTYFAGLTFTLRDISQERLGARVTFVAILAGAALSALISPQLALASSAAFALSESADFAVYTPLRRRGWMWAVIASNVFGLVVDSAAFLLLASGSLEFLPGQVVGKAWMTLLAVAAITIWRRRRERATA